MRLTDQMRSMIAGAFVNTQRGTPREKSLGLCCARDKLDACAAIVGRRNRRAAERLATFFYESLGCAVRSELLSDEENEERLDYYLDKISALEEI